LWDLLFFCPAILLGFCFFVFSKTFFCFFLLCYNVKKTRRKLMDCIFCLIANGQVDCHKIFEDEHTMAFLDIAHDVDGHTLVVPKVHATNILDCDEQTLAHVFSTVQKVAKHYVSLGYDGVNMLNANGHAAGQTVGHMHIHLFPRKTGDAADLWPHNDVAMFTLEEMHKKLKMQ
jgi:histidine triad (HIT) family protein